MTSDVAKAKVPVAAAVASGVAPMRASSLTLLVDTNVWLDFFIERSFKHEIARRLVVEAQMRNIQLFTAVHTVKDCYFLINAELKRMERAERGTVSESSALAMREVAWSCVKNLRRLSYIVPADDSDAIEAIIMRAEHPDFEDNLIAAAALRARADCVVTLDAGMLAHQPVSCITPEEALDLVTSR